MMLPLPYYDRALRSAMQITAGRDGIRAYDVDCLLQTDCWSYCLDSPEALPAGSMRGTTNFVTNVTTGYFPMIWRMA
jgi:hypothetical protein